MHVDVSMYFATVVCCRRPVFEPQTAAEERFTSSVCTVMLSSYAFSSCTRNVLYSGVHVFGSPTDAVRKFASGPS